MTATRSHQTSRRARATLTRLLAFACAVAVVLVAPLAHAAAPMCGEEGTSVVAPPPVLPIDGGRVAATSRCADDEPSHFFAQAPPAERAPLPSSAATPDRVLPWGHALLVRARSGLLQMTRPGSPPLPRGFRTAVFRPPRAR